VHLTRDTSYTPSSCPILRGSNWFNFLRCTHSFLEGSKSGKNEGTGAPAAEAPKGDEQKGCHYFAGIRVSSEKNKFQAVA